MWKQIAPLLFLTLSALPALPQTLLVGRRVYSPQSRTYQQIWSIDTRRNGALPLSNTPRRHVQPVCSPDGRTIWFLSGGFGDENNTELWAFDPLKRTEQMIATFQSSIVRLLGGTAKHIFFLTYEGTTPALCSWNGHFVKLARLAQSASEPAAVSPDGESIAAQTGETEVKLLNAAGASGNRLVNCAGPVWSPDARKLACASGQTVRVLDIVTGTESARATFRERSTPPEVAAISPDGSRLLVKTTGASQNSTSPQWDYWTVDLPSARWSFVGPGQSAIFNSTGKVVLVTPRDLGPVGNRKDWVSQLLEIDPITHAQTPLGLGIANYAEPCACPKLIAAPLLVPLKAQHPKAKAMK